MNAQTNVPARCNKRLTHKLSAFSIWNQQNKQNKLKLLSYHRNRIQKPTNSEKNCKKCSKIRNTRYIHRNYSSEQCTLNEINLILILKVISISDEKRNESIDSTGQCHTLFMNDHDTSDTIKDKKINNTNKVKYTKPPTNSWNNHDFWLSVEKNSRFAIKQRKSINKPSVDRVRID